MKKALAGLLVVLVLGAFVAGYWPQREALARARADSAESQRQLTEARAVLAAMEARVRLGRVFGQYLALRDAAEAGNFGDAGRFSSPFFDAVREEAEKAPEAAVRVSLELILAKRDAVTAALARNDASVRGLLAPIERELRRALGYPVPGPAATQPPGEALAPVAVAPGSR